jgi:serine protease
MAAAASTERYVVALERGVGAARGTLLLRDLDGGSVQPRNRDVSAFRALDGFAADLTADEAAAMRRAPGVRYVEKAVERHILGGDLSPVTNAARNLTGQTIPAGIDVVRAREVWSVTRGETINVAVVDTGVDYRHADLAGVWAGGFNAITQSSDPMDDNNHGTHVSGTIAAVDNDLGVVGVAPRVKLWGVKVLRANGTGSSDRVAAGLDWVIQQKRVLGGNWIVNMSLGASTSSVFEKEAVARVVAEGILIVAASGNESTTALPAPVSYPAAYPGVLAVGAVHSTLQIASFSNQGAELGVVAPGVDVLSSIRTGAGSISFVQAGSAAFNAAELAGSKKGTANGEYVVCGVGKDGEFPASVNGRIAVVNRGGDITFALKAKRAKAAGATAVVILNNVDDPALNFTLIDTADPTSASFDWPITVALTKADGARLLAANTPIVVSNITDDYDSNNGTSMASPHAAGVAALAWSVAQNATAADIRNAMILNAKDLGAAGFDNVFGHGVIDALSTAKMLNPAAFGSPSTPPPPVNQPSGRRTLRRGGR